MDMKKAFSNSFLLRSYQN